MLLIAALALSLAGCGSEDDDGGGGTGVTASCDSPSAGQEQLECKVLELVNQNRAAGATCGGNALPAVGALSMHPTLRQTARAHALDMATKGYFAHENLEGKSPFDRMSAAGYDWTTAGENIAGGGATPEGTMQQWMTSPGHCANIMKAEFQHLGVGYVQKDGSPLTHYWVQNFGSL